MQERCEKKKKKKKETEKGLVKAFEMGEGRDGYVYLTDLCLV